MGVSFEKGALEHIVDIANGDARSLLNALELAVETSPEKFPPPPGEKIFITQEAAEESIQRKVVLYDKEGDYHFDVISAFIKSIRGSDSDATLYWLAKMVRSGKTQVYLQADANQCC
jgi:putative ATPase